VTAYCDIQCAEVDTFDTVPVNYTLLHVIYNVTSSKVSAMTQVVDKFGVTDVAQSVLGRCRVVGSTLAFGSIGHGLESELHLFSHYSVSAFNKLRSLDDSVRCLLYIIQTASYPPAKVNR